jgi:hypothetical protein
MKKTGSSTFKRLTNRRTAADTGQAALVMVVGFSVLIALFGGIMVTSATNNEPILTKASIQRLAYRALASGLNAYQSAINADPYLASCNASSTSTQCAGLTYQSWTQVSGTNVGNGVIPEYYMFDNPQELTNSSTGAISYLEVQIVGSAGYPGNYSYYSTVAHFTPQNDFLNNVWWSNFESSDFPNANASDCSHYWAINRNPANNACTGVVWQSGDNVTGPVFSNDSLYTSGTPTFTGTVTTADPACLYVGGAGSGTCTTDTPPTYGHAVETPPVDNTELRATAIQGGCDYQGPTTITFNNTGASTAMTVKSPLSAGYPGNLTQTQTSTDSSVCPTNGSGAFPKNGVIYVDAASSGALSNNPFYSTTTGLSQLTNCTNCYYGATSNPGYEGDAFVGDSTTNGGFSGQLTVAANNDVIIQSPIIYQDCTSWVGTKSESMCNYNSSTASTPNDVLGLIANNFVEINRPLYNNNASGQLPGTDLPACNGTTWVPPLCEPSTSTGDPTGSSQGLTVDATILALNQSFVVNNYATKNSPPGLGTLYVYGSIQQDARGPVGLAGGNNGYYKYYTWDPRLPLYGPPYYLTPGTPSWSLDSSAESYTGLCPPMPPAQPKPVSTAQITPTTGDFTFATSTNNPPSSNNPVNLSPNSNSAAWASCPTP